MYIKNLLVISLAAAGAMAAPPPYSSPPYGGPGFCLSDADANQVAGFWTQLIGNYTAALADATLDPSFTDYSAAALSLNANCQQAPGKAPALGEPVFTSRDQFKMGQGPQPSISSTILQVWHSCTEVTMRYKLTNIGSGARPVFAIIAMETVRAPAGNTYPYQIKTVYSEFDSAAWISNLKDVNNCKTPTAS